MGTSTDGAGTQMRQGTREAPIEARMQKRTEPGGSQLGCRAIKCGQGASKLGG